MIIHDKDDIETICSVLRKVSVVGVVSGYFDPLRIGHLHYFSAGKDRCNTLIVILNNDAQLLLKRKGTRLEGKIRYPFYERAMIIDRLKPVDFVIKSIDTTGGIFETLKLIRPHYFFKGGDRDLTNIPQEEIDICKEIGCKIICGIGGEKITGSSWLDWELNE
jgi:bifunctional ADP-heptose synthase (sugar kinase/adenylyltransferase)